MTNKFKLILSCISMITFGLNLSNAQNIHVKNLQINYETEPLGLDVKQPVFSWHMENPTNERGIRQKTYEVTVTDENGNVIWKTGVIKSDVSNHIPYEGKALQASTRYNWEVKIRDNKSREVFAKSWFETGLMNSNPNLEAWGGAKWIGGSSEDLVFYSHYLSVFKMKYKLALDRDSGSTKASFIFGANDRRLMNRNLNIQGVENGLNESYISFELDISEVDGTNNGLAKLNIFRVGYDPNDSNKVPFKSLSIPLDLINESNKYEKHEINVECNFGLFEIYINGQREENQISKTDDGNASPIEASSINLNPVGKGNNYISFPMVADIGFHLKENQKALFSDIEIFNFRAPNNVLFKEELAGNNEYAGIFSNSIKENSKNLKIVGDGIVLSGRSNGLLIAVDPSKNSTPMLRTEFRTKGSEIKKARLYVTARGIYEVYLNGQRIGDEYFNPGLTQYNKTHMYQTYDVTNLVNNDDANALGALLSEGWWSGNITYSGENWNYFGDRQSLLAKLVITYEDGTTQQEVTNPSDWRYFNDGPILYSSFFQGEVYDATRENAINGWFNASYNDSLWRPTEEVKITGTSYLENDPESLNEASSFNYDDLQIIGQIGDNAKIVKTLISQSVEEVRPGVFLYDMGQNMVGFPQIIINSGKKGDTITARYSEVTYPDLDEYGENVGMVMLENIRAALTQDQMILKGGDEIMQPRFSFHGYRYIEITGIQKALPLEAVKGKVVSSIDELASNYKTSNDLVNKLWENITWSMRGNFLSIPTDTPARNERMGWSGDINVFSRASTYLGDVEPFLRRHLLAMRNIQREDGRFPDVAPVGGGFGGTLWGSAGIIVPWELYKQYGDVMILKEHYQAMKKYVEFLETKEDPETGVLNEGPLGDWLSPEGFKNDNTLFWNAYQVYCLEILAKSAEILEKPSDAKNFWGKYRQRKKLFNTKYVDKDTGRTIHSGFESVGFGPPVSKDKMPKAGDLVDTQASYAIPLAMNVFNEENTPDAVKHLAESIVRKNIDTKGVLRPEYSLMTGFIGTASLSEALSKNGHHDLAYRLLQQTSYPSWLYSVVNGATTIWERLNSYTIEEGFGGNNSMNSFNHYSFGAVAAWMYNYSLGIQMQEPGFKKILLKPTPDPDGVMTWAEGYYDSMYGRIESAWELRENGNTVYNISVPANTTAILHLPASALKKVEENGEKIKRAKGVSFISKETDRLIFELESGSYEFTVRK